MPIPFRCDVNSIFTRKIRRHLMVAACLTATLFGCSEANNIARLYDATPYSKGNLLWGEHYFDGYRDEKILENRYKIKAAGNRVTSITRTKNIALARAAEIGQELGFSHFKIVEENTSMFCSGMHSAGSTVTISSSSQPRVTIFVEYSKEKRDASYRSVAKISHKLMPALKDTSVPQERKEEIFHSNEKYCNGVI